MSTKAEKRAVKLAFYKVDSDAAIRREQMENSLEIERVRAISDERIAVIHAESAERIAAGSH